MIKSCMKFPEDLINVQYVLCNDVHVSSACMYDMLYNVYVS